MKTRFLYIAVLVALLLALPLTALADKPDGKDKPGNGRGNRAAVAAGTLNLVGDVPTTVAGQVEFTATWDSSISYPAFWLSCYQNSVRKLWRGIEPLVGDGIAQFHYWIPSNASDPQHPLWDEAGPDIICAAELRSYLITYDPVTGRVSSVDPQPVATLYFALDPVVGP